MRRAISLSAEVGRLGALALVLALAHAGCVINPVPTPGTPLTADEGPPAETPTGTVEDVAAAKAADAWVSTETAARRDEDAALAAEVTETVDVAGEATASTTDADPAGAPCPAGMAPVAGAFCIDRYEATLEEQGPDGTWKAASPYLTVGPRVVRAASGAGLPPQGYISGVEAAKACAAIGRRLCTSAEWLEACRGPNKSVYPYGNSHVPGACNDHYAGTHPVIDYFGSSDVFDAAHMNHPGINQQAGTITPGGAKTGCVSAWGAFDLHGNLHEWVADADGTFRGGFYADATINGAGCTYVTTAHGSSYHDYSTGFRCCVDLGG